MANIKQVNINNTLYDIEALKATQDGSGNVITSTYATKAVATASAKGLMSAVDKTKLDSILLDNLIDLDNRGTEITAGTDLNDLRTPGCYFSPSSNRTAELINAPYSGGGFRLFVFNSHNNQAKIQFLMGYGNVLFYRFYLASSNEDNPRWKEWVSLITIDPSLAGDYGPPPPQELPDGGSVLLPEDIFTDSNGYSGTFTSITVPAFTINNNGKITSINNKLYTVKDTTGFPDATTSKSGFMSAADKTKLNGLSDTKVTQKAVITTDGNYPVMLGNSTATTEVTGTINKSSKLLFNPSSGILNVNRITISNTSGVGHITFSRLTSYNYLHVPSSDESAALAFCVNETLSKENSALLIRQTDILPGKDSTCAIGATNYRWKNIFTDAVDSSGSITLRHGVTKGTVPTSALERTIKFTDSTGGTAAAAARFGMVYNSVSTSNNVTTAIYAYQANSTETSVSKRLYVTMNTDGTSASGSSADKFTCSKVYGAVWNDYAEFRICNDDFIPGQVVCENGDDTLSISNERLQPGANIISDTFGFAIGETDEAKCPIAVSGRVLAYTYEPREEFQAGDAVCAGPNGTVSKMTREEIREYPDRIIGTVSAIPNYEEWGTGKVSVNNRIWIKV